MPARSAVHGAVALSCVLALCAPVALADPAGKSTTDETIRPLAGSGYVTLEAKGGEAYTVRTPPSLKAASGRAGKRTSLAFFGQLTDPQIADEMSPARVDFLDPAGNAISSSWRPQEALGLQVFDQVVRNVNANRTSEVRRARAPSARSSASSSPPATSPTTSSSTRRAGSRACSTAARSTRSRASRSAPPTPARARRRTRSTRSTPRSPRACYTGVADYDDYRGVPPERYGGFWDPDEAAAGGPYAAFPRYPGLLERAQNTFTAEGLKVPWYIARGNHDGLVQGNAPASTDLFRAIATGCLKVFPSAALDPAQFADADEAEAFRRIGDPAYIQTLLAGGRSVPPDPDRRILATTEYKSEVGAKHGYRYVDAAERKASKDVATYYAFRPRKGIELISLDTVAEGGGSTGNLDDPQYKWLEKTLKQAQKADRLVVAYGHHTLATMNNTRTDEQAGSCTPPKPGCDADPRKSTPLHRGTKGAKTVRDLFLKYPNVIAYVVRPHAREPRRPLPQGQERLLADQHRLARRLAAAEPPDRADGQPRRHAVAVQHGAGPGRPDRRARARHGRRRADRRAARQPQPRAGVERPAAVHARSARPQAGPQRRARAPRPARLAAG